MKKYALCLGYLPKTNYSGFSSQLHDPKNILTQVISAFKEARLVDLEIDSEIRFASRTDRGVGALDQIVSLNAKHSPILPEINFYLSDSIRVLGLTKVSSSFHPRRDAILRTYTYYLTINDDFDIIIARKMLSMLVGRHDFRNFAKRDPKKEIGTIKDIKTAEIVPVADGTYQIRLSSKSFLWQQVRRIIGHLIEVSTGKYDLEYTQQLLEAKTTKLKPPTAPAEYLVLETVQYNDVQFTYDQKALHSFQQTLRGHLMDAKAKTALYEFITGHLRGKMV
ncbi:MAG: hypothetical protein JSV04_13485 [Candidatus Heimdallarchaeota archaeon]|nr:MAG: hypothetical protein JSV04_13485 [Candidatus Heimdallarchaeota archaeon]